VQEGSELRGENAVIISRDSLGYNGENAEAVAEDFPECPKETVSITAQDYGQPGVPQPLFKESVDFILKRRVSSFEPPARKRPKHNEEIQVGRRVMSVEALIESGRGYASNW
jgi:hypothetical protein